MAGTVTTLHLRLLQTTSEHLLYYHSAAIARALPSQPHKGRSAQTSLGILVFEILGKFGSSLGSLTIFGCP
jgi:hypothetical protein